VGRFQPLFSIAVNHDYFADGLCRELDFVPTFDTARLMRNVGLLSRTMRNGVGVFCEDDRREALQGYAQEARAGWGGLTFKVFSRDKKFRNYTDPGNPSIFKEHSILYCCNRDEGKDATGRTPLYFDEYLELYSSYEDVLSKMDALPVCIISIGITPSYVEEIFEQSAAPAEYYVRFNARKTFWKYYLVGDIARDDAYVVDLDGKTEFERGEEALPDDRMALTFRTKSSIALRERFDYRFQYRESSSGRQRGANGDRVLIKRLPVASARQIGGSGKQADISAIYIGG